MIKSNHAIFGSDMNQLRLIVIWAANSKPCQTQLLQVSLSASITRALPRAEGQYSEYSQIQNYLLSSLSFVLIGLAKMFTCSFHQKTHNLFVFLPHYHRICCITAITRLGIDVKEGATASNCIKHGRTDFYSINRIEYLQLLIVMTSIISQFKS